LTGFFFDWKTENTGFLRNFFPFFSGGIYSQEHGSGGVLGIPVFSHFYRIFCRDSCRTGIPVFPLDSSGFLRIPLDSCRIPVFPFWMEKHIVP
jgi:hypothetical protein